ncbi:MAG: S-adenosylmethionine hydrolase [Gammaproteobacteria bacterium]|jgi:S-adenosylmethionine hydrolase
MIAIFTDYGLQGPYLGHIYTVLDQYAPDVRIITLMADAPRFNPRASAYLLHAISRTYPINSIFFAVVDPGVGNNFEKPIIINADGRWFVGPNNGLFDLIARNNNKLNSWNIDWKAENISKTFHGRDLYAPLCGMLANKQAPPGDEFNWVEKNHLPDDLYEIIYIDDFGNAMTGIRASQINSESCLMVSGHAFKNAYTFSDVKPGSGFWFENSYGLVEVAINRGSANKEMGLDIGNIVKIN